jgi:hypothetical protein
VAPPPRARQTTAHPPPVRPGGQPLAVDSTGVAVDSTGVAVDSTASVEGRTVRTPTGWERARPRHPRRAVGTPAADASPTWDARLAWRRWVRRPSWGTPRPGDRGARRISGRWVPRRPSRTRGLLGTPRQEAEAQTADAEAAEPRAGGAAAPQPSATDFRALAAYPQAALIAVPRGAARWGGAAAEAACPVEAPGHPGWVDATAAVQRHRCWAGEGGAATSSAWAAVG